MERITENTVVVNSDPGLWNFCRKLESLFVVQKYLVITIKTGLDRTLDQNSKLWPMLTDISKQVVWYGKRYDKDSWKDILTGSFRKADFVPNTEGTGFVVLGLRTSKMSRKHFSDLIEFIYAFGASQSVIWSEKSEKVYRDVREAA